MPRTNPGLTDGIPLGFEVRWCVWNPVGIRTAAAMETHDGAEANVVDAGGPEIGPPVSAANPNGIEIIQPRVARRGLHWEPRPQHASTLKGLNHRTNEVVIRTDAAIPPTRRRRVDAIQPRWG